MLNLRLLVVGATGGLGQALAREALKRGHTVSVMVRSQEKLTEVFAKDTARFHGVHVGDGTDREAILAACGGVDVVLNSVGSRAEVAAALANAARDRGVRKLVHVAGATNVLGEDGVTPHWKQLSWPPAERAYHAHQAAIDAIVASGINYVVFCPAFMKSTGAASQPAVPVRINRPSGGFVSYEDAAVVMVDAAEKGDWDRQLITAATQSKV
eukprot:TRINITY_DN27066_c0_g1_i1.p1 TRINITY_DN27066_c0_g1~~TRINITY_DN27066_c0_g1_i1.p1  ORF type:complete len:212 (+),score=5.24 TRINITY_DN27066_c0_g1_i1:87-722(+)